jgi:hypothetical protein
MKQIITLIVIISFCSCGDDGPNCPGDICIPVEISPYKSYYNIGDTITFLSIFNKLIYDAKTDKFYNASKYNFGPIISVFCLDSIKKYGYMSQVNLFCDFIKQVDSKMYVDSLENRTIIVGDYLLEEDSLGIVFKLKLVKSGFYWISTESYTTGDGHLQNNYQFNCRGRYINFYLKSPMENNIQFMQKFRNIYPNDYYLSDSINRFFHHAGYCFEVR